MTDLNRVKHLAGLTVEMDSARGLLKEYAVTDEADRHALRKLAGIEEAMVDGEITKDSVKKSALELLVDIAKTSKQYKGEVTDDQVHYLGSLVHDFDMAGIETEKYSEIEKLFRTASATKKADMTMIQPAYAQAKALDVDTEGNAYAHAVKQAKMNGKKKGDKVKGPDGDEITLEKEKTPIGEFILSYFDRENGTFPKGETAVLTMVEKDYGDQYVEPAAKFMQQAESMCKNRRRKKAMDSRYPETDRIKALAGM